jgi:putative two-component system response regulator
MSEPHRLGRSHARHQEPRQGAAFQPGRYSPPAARGDLFTARILMVDDEEVNLRMLRRMLERAGYTRIIDTTEPEKAVDLFLAFKPDLILLDLHMAPLDGFSVLARLEPLIPGDDYIPILMLTGDSSPPSKQRALSLGAKDFVTKPFDIDEVLLRINNLLIPRFMHLALASHNQLLERQVRERTRALEQSRLEVLERLARAAEFRDYDTGQHTRRVGRIAASLAAGLGVEPVEVEMINRAAQLHDVGKIGVPDQILLKPGKLTREEFQTMQRHSRIGAEILAGGRSSLIQTAAEIAHHHHERWDGSGYPAGLTGDEIPLGARVVALADVFDALAHNRPYRNAWPLEDVLAEIHRQAGRHFDPRVVEVFRGLEPERLLADD